MDGEPPGVFVSAYVAYAAVLVGLNVVGRFLQSSHLLGPLVVAVMALLFLFRIPSMMRETRS